MLPKSDGSPEAWMLWTAVVALFLYLQVVWHRSRLALTECCLAVGYLCVIFPSGTFSFYVSGAQADTSQPTCIFHLIFACLVSQALTLQLTRNSLLPEVTVCSTISSILTRIGLAFCALQGILDVKTVSNFSCMVTLVVLLPLIIGDLIHLFHMSANYDTTVGDPISWHISFDAMATFFLGGCAMAFPGLLCANMDEASSLLVKALGCMLIGQSLLSFGSLTYRDEKDARATLKAKLVMHGICALAGAASCYTDTVFWSNGHPVYLSMVGIILAWNAGAGIVAGQLHQKSQ